MSAPDAGERSCARPGAWGTCLEGLADGWHGAQDLCPACTRAFMTALDGIAGPMVWHPAFSERARTSHVPE